jgi:hypothetical protein
MAHSWWIIISLNGKLMKWHWCNVKLMKF